LLREVPERLLRDNPHVENISQDEIDVNSNCDEFYYFFALRFLALTAAWRIFMDSELAGGRGTGKRRWRRGGRARAEMRPHREIVPTSVERSGKELVRLTRDFRVLISST
jgi:hypothetical protein